MEANSHHIVELQIDRLDSNLYEAQPYVNGVPVADASTYASLGQAIACEAEAIPVGFARFVEARYRGVSTGTIHTAEAALRSNDLAERLVSLAIELNSHE